MRIFALLTLLWPQAAGAQAFLSNLHATADDPIFATYAAPLGRSSYIVDEGYRFIYYDRETGIRMSTDHAGDLGLVVALGGEVAWRVSDLHEEPVVTTSYADVVKYTYRPFPEIRIDAAFQVYSSSMAVHEITISNEGRATAGLSLYPFLHREAKIADLEIDPDLRHATFSHTEPLDRWMQSKRDQIPYVPERRDVLLLSEPGRAAGAFGGFGDFMEAVRTLTVGSEDQAGEQAPDSSAVVAFRKDLSLAPGQSATFRIVRGVSGEWMSPDELVAGAVLLTNHSLEQAVRDNEIAYEQIPPLKFDDADVEMMYWSAFTLMRQLMMPAEGKTSYNHYVYSREPTWGWGYAGQVFHESIAMLAYVFMDPESARNSQRVFMERQWENGYIPYRVGPYLDESIFTRGEFTASAPWFSWENWEIYLVDPDRNFLEDAYASGARLYDWWRANRDDDGDGLMEWGGHAVLESIRDSEAAVWDEVSWPNDFESPDLNAMLVKEARSLAEMAHELGLYDEAETWHEEADRRAEMVRTQFWDEEDGFFYYIDKRDNEFTFQRADDLKRQEIVGFFPMWAGIATHEQAERLVKHLVDPNKFWRPYGIPSLAADDSYYNPQGYWNGPVWIELNYLVFRALLDYGYDDVARELADRIFRNVVHHLKKDHTFWEFYSPDALWAGRHQTYIWTAIVARMLIELERR